MILRLVDGLLKIQLDLQGGDTNLYGYVLNDPVNFVDPSGLIIPALVAASVFEVSFDITTLSMEYKRTGSFKKAWEAVVERSPLNNLTSVGVDASLGPAAPFVQPFLDPTMADTMIKMNKHNKDTEKPCPD